MASHHAAAIDEEDVIEEVYKKRGIKLIEGLFGILFIITILCVVPN